MADATLPIRFALSQQGKPYLWGGNGPDSYDCSGLMVAAYDTIGRHLPRTTQEMLSDSSLAPVNTNQLQPGDLVFPSDEHVQMYLGGGKVVEAPRTGLNIRVTGLGKVFAARRVVNPSGVDWSGTPISATVPITATPADLGGSLGNLSASELAEMFGKGLTGGGADVLKPVLTITSHMITILFGGVFVTLGALLLYAQISRAITK